MTLIHEVSHISQSQNSGGDYIHTALVAQVIASIGSWFSGDTPVSDYAAYDWRSGINSGVPYDAMTPEQQTHLAEEIGIAILNNTDDELTIDDFTRDRSDGTLAALTLEEYDFIMAAWEEIKAGDGAV